VATSKRQLLKNRIFDLQYLLQSKGILFNFETAKLKDYINSPQLDVFIFSTKGRNQPLSRATTTNDFNQLLKDIPEFKEIGRRITSHSFRHGFIDKYWRDSKDIELVRQIVGHARIDTTQKYTKALSQEDLKKRIELIEEN